MRVLITGNLGYIGPVMVDLFKQAGHHVTGFDSGYFDECLSPDGRRLAPPDRQILCDIRKVEPEHLHGADAVVHLAGLSNDPMGALDPGLTERINTGGTRRLAKLARECGVGRFVFASSCSIYGAAADGGLLDEQAPFNPVSAYAVSKVAGEEVLRELAAPGFSPVFLRNATAFGVSPRMRFDLVLNNLMGWAWTTGEIRVLSDGTPWRPLVHIEDISRAALAAVTAPADAIHAQAFNIGRADANYQVRDIAMAVGRWQPEATVSFTGETVNDPRSYCVDFTKALTKLPGFDPYWTLERGCEELRSWLAAGSLAGRDFQSRLFVRLKQLQHRMEKGELDADLQLLSPSM